MQELVEAEEPDHVAAEAADVLYFTMTRCVAAGVGLRCVYGTHMRASYFIICIKSHMNSCDTVLTTFMTHIHHTSYTHIHYREIEAHLDRRTYKVTRRPGNAKEWRTNNAESVSCMGDL